MAKVYWICVVLYFSSEFVLSNVFSTLLDGAEPCNKACDKTYPLQTYPNSKHSECCKRGCRFYTLVELVNERSNANATRDACMASCMEAYSQTADRYACNIGCSSQVPNSISTQNGDQDRPEHHHDGKPQTLHLLTPFMYVHNIYNNMLDHVSRMISVSWSFYFQQDDGKVVVIQSEPEILTEYLDMDDAEDKSKDDMSSDGSDDLIVAADGAAELPASDSAKPKDLSDYSGSRTVSRQNEDSGSVPDIYFYHQQATGNGATGQDLPVRITVSAYTSEELQSVDWLGCVSRKSGLPRWLLGLIIFLSAVVMVWLCFATTATAPEHHIRPQILNVYSDMDYLKASASEKVRIQPFCDDDDEELLLAHQAPPLPVKVNLEKM